MNTLKRYPLLVFYTIALLFAGLWEGLYVLILMRTGSNLGRTSNVDAPTVAVSLSAQSEA